MQKCCKWIIRYNSEGGHSLPPPTMDPKPLLPFCGRDDAEYWPIVTIVSYVLQAHLLSNCHIEYFPFPSENILVSTISYMITLLKAHSACYRTAPCACRELSLPSGMINNSAIGHFTVLPGELLLGDGAH